MTQPVTSTPSRLAATLAGGAAILMWALLALFTDATGEVPPFQLAAMSFAIGTVVCLAFNWIRSDRLAIHRPGVAIAGTLGLFGYHALYFTALRHAPAIEASLIAYLWPLLIVVGSALLPGERLRWFHILGALVGFLGTGLIVTGGNGFSIKADYIFGYAVALVASFTWASYSLASRRFADVPSTIVTWYCLGSTILAVFCHMSFETSVWPETTTQWSAVVALGLLPVGAAFFVWDIGMKYGHVAVIGAASYAAPLLSALILIAFGRAEATWAILLACILITLGAVLAAKDLILPGDK